MIFFSSQFSNWELWTLRNVFKIVNRRFLANFCVFIGIQICCYHWVLCATCWAWGTAGCLVRCSFPRWAGSGRVLGSRLQLCAMGGRGAFLWQGVEQQGEVLRCALCALQLPAAAWGMGMKWTTGAAVVHLEIRQMGLLHQGKATYLGCSLQCHSSGVSNGIHTFHTVNCFHWAVSKGLTDINESYQHSRGALSQPRRQRKWNREKVSSESWASSEVGGSLASPFCACLVFAYILPQKIKLWRAYHICYNHVNKIYYFFLTDSFFLLFCLCFYGRKFSFASCQSLYHFLMSLYFAFLFLAAGCSLATWRLW